MVKLDFVHTGHDNTCQSIYGGETPACGSVGNLYSGLAEKSTSSEWNIQQDKLSHTSLQEKGLAGEKINFKK